MKTICIIPARGNSKGLINKNIRQLYGKPLIYWPIKAAKMVKEIDYILLSTDSKKIANLGKKYGAHVPFLRSSSISGDRATTENVLKYSLSEIEKIENTKFDIGVFLTCTDIFRDIQWIKTGIKKLKKNKKIESCFIGNSTTKNYWHKVNNRWKRLMPHMKYYSSRQEKKKIYREDTGLTCVSRANLWRMGKRIGNNVHIIENANTETFIDIHNEYDLFLAEKTIEFYKIKNKKKIDLFLK